VTTVDAQTMSSRTSAWRTPNCGNGSLVGSVVRAGATVAADLITRLAPWPGPATRTERGECRRPTGHGVAMPQMLDGGSGRAVAARSSAISRAASPRCRELRSRGTPTCSGHLRSSEQRGMDRLVASGFAGAIRWTTTGSCCRSARGRQRAAFRQLRSRTDAKNSPSPEPGPASWQISGLADQCRRAAAAERVRAS
jgi:hypothetical protein